MKFRACALVLAFAAPLAVLPVVPAVAQAAAKYTLDTPIETLVSDPAAKAVIDADIPNLTAHPMFNQFKVMSLRQLAPLSNGLLTDELLAKVERELAAIK